MNIICDKLCKITLKAQNSTKNIRPHDKSHPSVVGHSKRTLTVGKQNGERAMLKSAKRSKDKHLIGWET